MIAGVEFGGDSKPLDGNKRERISMGFFVWVLPQDQGHNYRHMEEEVRVNELMSDILSLDK